MKALLTTGKQNALVILLAILPSLLFFLFIPFTWNFIDSFVYLTSGLKSVFPHYPPLYNGICLLAMQIFSNHSTAIYSIIALQHMVFITGLLYIATLFERTRLRIIFLLIMMFNLPLFLVVNGLYPEGLFIGLQLIFWGAFFRLFFYTKNVLWHALIMVICLALFPLIKHIGILWCLILLSAAFFILIAGVIKRKRQQLILAAMLFAIPLASWLTLSIVMQSISHIYNVPNQSKIGRTGEYRIKALPWNSFNSDQKENLLKHYTGDNPDTMVRKTYELIMASNNLWMQPYQQLDSLLVANHSTKNADDYMNMAFRSYLIHIEHYAIDSICADISLFLNYQSLGDELVRENTLLPFGNEGSLSRDDMRYIRRDIFSQKNYLQLSHIVDSGIFTVMDSNSLKYLFLANLFLLLFCLKKISTGKSFFILSLIAFPAFYMVATSVATIFVPRYMIPPMLELHIALALLVVCAVSQRRQAL